MQRQRIETLSDGNIRLTIPYLITKRGNGRRLITPEGDEPVGDTQRKAMLFAFARARRCQRLIDEGRISNAKALAAKIGRDQSYVANIIGIVQISPKIIHAVIRGDYPKPLTLATLKRKLPDLWCEQEAMLLGEN